MLRVLFASTALFVLAGVAPAFSQAATFDKPSYQSGYAAFALSDDKRAFTFNFDKPFEATIGNIPDAADTKAPVSTRVFSAVIPVAGKDLATSFFVTGFLAGEAGTNSTIVLSVNGQHIVWDSGPTKEDQPFLVELKYQAASTPDIRLSVMLRTERNSANAGASSILRVTAIDTDAEAAKKRMAAAKR